jgi:predicted RNA-binding protein YlqC (UPF0109 family)
MSEIDQQFIEYVVKSLVGKPDAVHIDRRIDEKGVLLELTVDPEDLGRVIGKRGATAQSLRTLLRALGTKNDARYNLKIIDNGTGPAPSPARSDDTSSDVADSSNVTDDSVSGTDSDSNTVDDEPATANQPGEPMEEDQPDSEVAEAEAAVPPEAETSDRLAQARRELADLDDLDV